MVALWSIGWSKYSSKKPSSEASAPGGGFWPMTVGAMADSPGGIRPGVGETGGVVGVAGITVTVIVGVGVGSGSSRLRQPTTRINAPINRNMTKERSRDIRLLHLQNAPGKVRQGLQGNCWT